jgi:hypothetical protein
LNCQLRGRTTEVLQPVMWNDASWNFPNANSSRGWFSSSYSSGIDNRPSYFTCNIVLTAIRWCLVESGLWNELSVIGCLLKINLESPNYLRIFTAQGTDYPQLINFPRNSTRQEGQLRFDGSLTSVGTASIFLHINFLSVGQKSTDHWCTERCVHFTAQLPRYSYIREQSTYSKSLPIRFQLIRMPDNPVRNMKNENSCSQLSA